MAYACDRLVSKSFQAVFALIAAFGSANIAIAQPQTVHEKHIISSKTERIKRAIGTPLESTSESEYPVQESPSNLIAAPENFNPFFKLPPPPPPPPPKIETPPEPEPETTERKSSPPILVLDSINPNFNLTKNASGQRNQFAEQTAVFKLDNGNLIKFKTGYNSFENKDIEIVNNIPIKLGWEGKLGKINLAFNGGIDLFNRLPPAPNLDLNISSTLRAKVNSQAELSSLLVVGTAIEYQPYKFNAKTLENQIQFFRLRPSIYWQITSDLSFFAFGQIGLFNDGNQEFQSFSRLEKKIGSFSVATNLFLWSFADNLESSSGYFSPPDFLVYNAELAWQGHITKFIKCRLAGSLGKQRLNGDIATARVYQASCTAQLFSNIEADLGYTNSNISTQGSSSTTENIAGQIRFNF
jgi:hypothetical protein